MAFGGGGKSGGQGLPDVLRGSPWAKRAPGSGAGLVGGWGGAGGQADDMGWSAQSWLSLLRPRLWCRMSSLAPETFSSQRNPGLP